MNYQQKYLKYKQKYFELNDSIQTGGINKKKLYENINNDLTKLSNEDIKKIITVKKTDKFKKWGLNKVYMLNKNKIFIKAIPVAKLFMENILDTTNLYNVPAFYNYGFGSAGVNPWRELILHIKTTNYVLDDDIECDFFPLLYHYRIIEDDNNNNNDNIESGLSPRLMKRWNNDKNIKKYLKDRINSKHKIVLFLEYIPNVAYKYLEKSYNFVENFYEQTKHIIIFCNKNGILHNDSHLGNYIIDNKKKVYLTDFGLSLSEDFNLSIDEKKFMRMNVNLDKYYTIDDIASIYINNCLFNNKIKQKYQLETLQSSEELYEYLINNIDEVKKDVKMSDFHIKFIKNNKMRIINFVIWMHEFMKSKDKNNYFIE